MKKYFLFIVSIMFLSCREARLENNINFDEAQPFNDSELRKIPSKFIGNYLDNDSILLTIGDSSILHVNKFKLRIHKSEIDSLKDELIYKDGKFIEKKTNSVLENKVFGDSIEFIIKDIDTVFKFSKHQKAKRANGKLVLSTKDSLYWRIKILTLDKNVITIQQLSSDADLRAIDSITTLKSKLITESNYLVKPSREEFLKILKLKEMGSQSNFKKIKQP